MSKGVLNSNSELYQFIHLAHLFIKKMGGIREVEKKMNGFRSKSKYDLIRKIFHDVSDFYGVPSENIIQSKKRKDVTEAKVMCALLLVEIANTPQKQIAENFGISEAAVSSWITSWKRINDGKKIKAEWIVKIFNPKFIAGINRIKNGIN